MNERDEIEIDLIDLAKFCWKKKKYFIIPLAIASVLVVAFCVISIVMSPEKSPLPNKYTGSTKILVRETSSGSSVSSSLASLAALGGVNLGSSKDASNSVLLETLASTNSFKDDIVNKFNLVERYKIEKKEKYNSRKKLDKALSVSMAKDDPVLTVSFTDIDPAFAKEVAEYASELLIKMFYDVSVDDNTINLKNYREAMDASFAKIVQYQKDIQELEQSVSNSYASSIPSIMFDVQMKKMELEAEQTIYANFRGQHELLSIQMENEPTMLKIIQEAEVPEEKSGPSRAKICIIVDLIVFVGCFVWVFIKYYQMLLKKTETTEVVAK